MKSFLSGGFGSVTAKTVTAPFSRVTILMQIQSTCAQSRKSAIGVCREIYAQDGLRSFWRGNWASCLHRFPYSGITFLVHDYSAGVLSNMDFPSSAVDFTSGALAGGVGACVTYPMDVVRLRLSAQTGPRMDHCGMCQTIASIASAEGPMGFYKGLFPTLLHVVPSFAINFQVFGSLKKRYQKSHSGEGSGGIPLREAFYYGCGAGFFSSAILFPIDLIRRQLQVDGRGGSVKQYRGIKDVVRKVYATGGLRGFSSGLAVELIKVVPFVGIMFMTVEWLKRATWPMELELKQVVSVRAEDSIYKIIS